MALGKALFHLVSIRGTILEKDYVKRHLPNLITCEDYSPFVSNMRHIIKMQNFPSKCNSLRKCSLFFSLPYSFIQVGEIFLLPEYFSFTSQYQLPKWSSLFRAISTVLATFLYHLVFSDSQIWALHFSMSVIVENSPLLKSFHQEDLIYRYSTIMHHVARRKKKIPKPEFTQWSLESCWMTKKE